MADEQGVHAWLPEYAKPDLWLNEDDNAIQFIYWKDDPQPYMALWWHRPRQPGGAGRPEHFCHGGFQWRRPDESIQGALWTLENWQPLTLSPSLHCLDCGAHGFIRAGKWVPV